MSKTSQNDEVEIQKYIIHAYLDPIATVQILCFGMEYTFLDIFRRSNPALPFLTHKDLLELSLRYHHETSGGNLQETLKFIKMQLNEYYNFIFDIWICFRFKIIERIDDGITDPKIIKDIIIEHLHAQLRTLLNYLFDSIFYITVTRNISNSVKESMIKKNVVETVLLYSRLYIFLQQPDTSLPFFTFNKQNILLVLLSNVMIYKYFDSLHKISSKLIENYISCIQQVFNRCISIFGDTPTDENKEKIDFALGHLAVYFLNLLNLSFILSNSEVQPIFICRQIEAEFEKKEILFVQEPNGKKIFTLEAAEALRRSGDVTVFNVRRDLVFDPMSENTTLQNAVEFVSEVRQKLNEKQRSSISEDLMNPIIQDLERYYNTLKAMYDYFSFILFLSELLQKFISTNSKKGIRLKLRSNFSECSVKVPEFIICTIEECVQEDARIETKENMQQLRDALKMEKQKKEDEEKKKRFDDMKLKKEQQRKKEDEKIKAQQAAAAAAATSVVAVPKELSEKEKSAFITQRIGSFKNDIKSIFPIFSAAIQSGEYEDAATMLNEKMPAKLRENVPWTATNMEKFSPKMMQAYQELLVAEQPADAVVAVSSPVVSISPPVAAPVESIPPTISKKAAKAKAAAPLEEAEAIEKQRLEEAEALEKQRLAAEAAALEAAQKRAQKKILRKQAKEATAAAAAQEAAQNLAAEQAAAEEAAAEEAAAFNEFRENIRLLYGGNGITYFETMFRCSLPHFFRITTVVRGLPDQEIIRIMSTLTPVPDSVSARAPPLTTYMDLANSGQNCRALFVLALLSGIRRVENVRFSFVGRTFLQLLACYSRLPPEKCAELHIPTNTSDFDVYIIFNNDKDPMMMRPFFLHIFNLFWNIPPENIDIHYSRDDRAWRQFEDKESGNGHLYESITRGTPEIMKISFNSQGRVFEVSDIGFKSIKQFSDIFRFSLPHGSPVATVDQFNLLELKYTFDQRMFFSEPQENPCLVQLDFQFPSASSGFDESINIILNILNSFLTNSLNLDGAILDTPIDFYFIHVSNLLKFTVRAIQYKGIEKVEKGVMDVRAADIIIALKSKRNFKRLSKNIEDGAIDFIKLFFNDNGINHDFFERVDGYRNTGARGAAIRTTTFRYVHDLILSILRRYGFRSDYLDAHRNLYGGIKQKKQQQQQQRKHTKKNKMNKNKRYSIKLNKIKKIKIKQNGKKSLKYHKQNNYKITKKY